MFMASMRNALRDGELKDDGMTSAWVRSAVAEYEAQITAVNRATEREMRDAEAGRSPLSAHQESGGGHG